MTEPSRKRLQVDLDHARYRWDEYKRLAELTASDLSDAEDEVARLKEELELSVAARKQTADRADRAEARASDLWATLALAHGCLLEVRRDFDAPINGIIAEVRATLAEPTVTAGETHDVAP